MSTRVYTKRERELKKQAKQQKRMERRKLKRVRRGYTSGGSCGTLPGLRMAI
jgi:hypothetical protein